VCLTGYEGLVRSVERDRLGSDFQDDARPSGFLSVDAEDSGLWDLIRGLRRLTAAPRLAARFLFPLLARGDRRAHAFRVADRIQDQLDTRRDAKLLETRIYFTHRAVFRTDGSSSALLLRSSRIILHNLHNLLNLHISCSLLAREVLGLQRRILHIVHCGKLLDLDDRGLIESQTVAGLR
jgi:hypothetical protein